MTLFKNNTIFNFKFRTYFIHLFFYLLTVFFFCSPFLGLKFLPPKMSVLIAIIVLTLKQLFNIFLFNCKLNVKDDIIELYDSATNRLIETISGNELGELVQKLNMASGIFVNKKV